jgi:hypothetical protein
VEITNLLFIHIAFVILQNVLVKLYWGSDEHQYKRLAIFTIDLLLPVFGCCAILIFVGTVRMLRGNSIYEDEDIYNYPFGESEYHKFVKEKEDDLKEKYIPNSQEYLRDNLEIYSFIDLLDHDNNEIKKDAIEKSLDRKEKGTIKFLKKALESNNYEIMYLAKNNLERIEGNIFTKIKNISESLEKNINSDLLNERARCYLDLSYFDLLDEKLIEKFSKKALKDIYASLKLNPKQNHLYLQIVRIYTQLNLDEKAITFGNQILEENFSEEIKTKIKFYLAESYYKLKQYKEVNQILKQQKTNKDYKAMCESIVYWSSI